MTFGETAGEVDARGLFDDFLMASLGRDFGPSTMALSFRDDWPGRSCFVALSVV
jgi:hypothetical protein